MNSAFPSMSLETLNRFQIEQVVVNSSPPFGLKNHHAGPITK